MSSNEEQKLKHMYHAKSRCGEVTMSFIVYSRTLFFDSLKKINNPDCYTAIRMAKLMLRIISDEHPDIPYFLIVDMSEMLFCSSGASLMIRKIFTEGQTYYMKHLGATPSQEIAEYFEQVNTSLNQKIRDTLNRLSEEKINMLKQLFPSLEENINLTWKSLFRTINICDEIFVMDNALEFYKNAFDSDVLELLCEDSTFEISRETILDYVL